MTLLVICLVVSNILENTSVLTGFPFGHYHYTDVANTQLFLVPLVVGPLYFSTGYLAWVLSIVLVGDLRRKGSWFTTFAQVVLRPGYHLVCGAWADVCTVLSGEQRPYAGHRCRYQVAPSHRMFASLGSETL